MWLRRALPVLQGICCLLIASRWATAHEHSGDWNRELLAGATRHVRHVHEISTDRDYDLEYYDIGGVNITFGDIALQPEYIDFLEGHGPNEVPQVPNLLGIVHEDDGRRWSCPIPYVIDSAMPNQQRVPEAIEQIEWGTRWRFVERTTEDRYLRFFKGSGCWSYVGKNYGSGAQDISLADGCTTGSTVHEILHAIGAWHEQSRSDRDQYITVNYGNIQEGQEHNFDIHTGARLVRTYDYNSIMHYGTHAFSSNGGATISVNGGLPDGSCGLGQRGGMSPTDALAAMDRWYSTTQCPTQTKQLIPGMTVRFESVNYPGSFLRHQNGGVYLAQGSDSGFVSDSSFVVEPGLSGRGLSFRSTNINNNYLAHSGFTLYLRGNESTDAFREEASFNLNGALEGGSGNRLSLSGVDNQGRFVRHRSSTVYLDPLDSGSSLFRNDATWNLHVTAGVSFTQTNSFGGSGGSAFSDSVGAEITAINVRSGSSIDNVQVEYGGALASGHGGSGGSLYRFELQSGESITSACVFADNEVRAIEFHTSFGRSSPKYGGCNGDLRCFFFGNERLRYISGRSGSRLDQITFHY